MIALTKNRNERPTWPWQAAAATLQLLFGAGKVLAGALAGCFFARCCLRLCAEGVPLLEVCSWLPPLAAAILTAVLCCLALLLGAYTLSGWRAACSLAALWRLHCCFFLAGALPEAWRLLWRFTAGRLAAALAVGALLLEACQTLLCFQWSVAHTILEHLPWESNGIVFSSFLKESGISAKNRSCYGSDSNSCCGR